MRKGAWSGSALALAWGLAAAPAWAQDALSGDAPPPVASPPAAAEGATSYTPSDFARFSPRTALDMLRQVPGFTILEQDERRGLGQATANVLINGQRLSGKSNDVVTELGRIPAGNVTRVDIVDGATLDVPGLSGQVANILTASTGISGAFAWRPQMRLRRTPARLTNGEASVTGKVGGIDYTVAIENQSFRNGNAGPERVTRADGTLIDLRDEVLSVDGEAPKISATLRRRSANGSIANLNASFQLYHQDVEEISIRRPIDAVARNRRVTEREREHNYEIGGDYEFGLGGGRLKLIGLRRFEHSPFTQTLVEEFPFEPGRDAIGDRFRQVADETETILRSEYRWRAGGGDWQVSLEGALNQLDVESGLFRLSPAGAFEPVPLFNSNSAVEEKRAEAMLSYGRPVSRTLTLQASLGGEYSQLSQTGDAGLVRSFIRPKGFVSVAWKPNPRFDFSAKLQREVGQLNFFDFVASANVSGGTTNAGNVNLVPQQSWNLDLEASYNLGAWGTTRARLYGREITDIVDFVPIGESGQAPGNLERASIYGIQWTSTFTFDAFGWKGAKLDLDVQFQKTELEDPVTGVRRAINEELVRRLVANFRQDVPETDWAYGFGINHYRQSRGFRLDQSFLFYDEPGNVGVFVEHKDVLGLTVRAAADNLIGTNESFRRTFFNGRRTNEELFTESRDRFYGPVFSMTISGKI